LEEEQAGISKKFYGDTFSAKLLRMKNSNPIPCLEMLVTSTFQTTAAVKLWRYFCLLGFPNFFTLSLSEAAQGGENKKAMVLPMASRPFNLVDS